jgi:hypothetical protein
MSLVTQIRDGRLGAWFAEWLPGTGGLVAEVQRAVAGVAPVRPGGRPDLKHYAMVGGALGLRVAQLVEPAPPYAAILGVQRAEVFGPERASQVAGLYPTHRQLDRLRGARAMWCRPVPGGWWDLGGPVPSPDPGPEPGPLMQFFAAHAGDRDATGRIGDEPEEARRAVACWRLGELEEVYRAGRVTPAAEVLLGGGTPSPAEQMQRELVQLALLVTRSAATVRELAGYPPASQRLGHAAPLFVEHWAEGDVLLGPARHDQGYTLLDVKAVTGAGDGGRVAHWLYQLLGYCWLDVTDRWRIRRAGLWFARHGVIVTWPVEQFIDRLLGCRGAADAARQVFLHQVASAIAEDGGHIPDELHTATCG